jgi:hypothetical protein
MFSCSCPKESQHCQGGVVDGASFVPDPVALSSVKAEHQIAAFGVSGCEHRRQAFQEMQGLDADTAPTVPILRDSQSAMAMASSDRDTRRTRRIRGHHHCMRVQISNGAHVILKINGTLNISDIGAKLQDSCHVHPASHCCPCRSTSLSMSKLIRGVTRCFPQMLPLDSRPHDCVPPVSHGPMHHPRPHHLLMDQCGP